MAEERMLVTQALDQKGLTEKKIRDAIQGTNFVDTKKINEEKVYGARVTKEDFTKDTERSYQKIIDQINRYQKINEAITESNAKTIIKTSCGDLTVAAAISLRRILQNSDYDDSTDFEYQLQEKMKLDFGKNVGIVEMKNKQLQTTAESMRLSILGKDTKVKDEKPLAVVDEYIRENTTELIDPLDVQKKIKYLQEKRDTLLSELDTQIKISNATTFIEI